MKHEEIEKINNGISELLSNRHFGEALAKISNACHRLNLTDLRERAETLQRDYNYMLSYYAQGSSDPAREQMFDHLYNDSWTLLDLWCDRAEQLSSSFYYYSEKRMLQQRGLTLPSIVDDFIALCAKDTQEYSPQALNQYWEEIDARAETLWLAIWTDFPTNREHRSAIHRLLLEPSVPLAYRASFLSAMTVGLLSYFDAEKTEDLFTFTIEGLPHDLTQRAWIGYFLVILKHNYRIDHLPRLQSQIQFIIDEHKRRKPGEDNLLLLQMLILQACATRDVERKLNDEIMPDIFNEIKGLSDKMKDKDSGDTPIRIIEVDEDGEGLSINPEWQNSKLGKRFHDYAQLQSNGVDTRYSAFRSLSRMNFFRNLCHWFVTFDTELPWFRAVKSRLPELLKLQNMMRLSQKLCNTEANATTLFISETLMKSQKENGKTFPPRKLLDRFSELFPTDRQEFSMDETALTYTHDLYRFFTLAPHCEEWENPFDNREYLFFASSAWLAPLISRKNEAQDIAEYLFNHERWKEAVYAIQKWLDFEVSEEALQKLAYAAYQKEVDDPTLAREALIVCNHLYPDKKWTVNYLISFYLKEEEYNTAEIMLQHAVELWPDDRKLLLKQAECFIAQHRWKDAFGPLFKIDLREEGLSRVNRLLARCYMMTKHNAKAEQYISSVLNKKPVRKDWLLGGHIALQAGNIPKAIERYRKCMASGKWTMDKFQERVFEDWPNLIEVGIKDSDLSLALETLRHQIGQTSSM